MKFKTTQREINNGYYNRICIGYCDLQYLLYGLDPIAYTCGVYGWNADIYQLDNNTVIITGYRPFGNISADYEYNRKMDTKARKIVYNYDIKPETRRRRLEKLRNEFINHYMEVRNNEK